MDMTTRNGSAASSVNTVPNRRGTFGWEKIIVTKLGYEAFMDHLETEFSIENLLFATEV